MSFLKRISISLKKIIITQLRHLQYEPELEFSLRNPWKHRFFPFKHSSTHLKKRKPYTEAFEVEINSMTTRLGFSFFEDGWHPFVQTLEEYKLDNNLQYEDSTLAKVYELFTPKNMEELIFSDGNHSIDIMALLPAHYYFITNIWLLNKKFIQKKLNEYKELGNEQNGWILYGPHSPEYGKKEFERLIGVYNSFKSLGYNIKYQTNHIDGYFLKNNGEMKFVLLQGNHRVAALKCLGYKYANVIIRNGHPIIIDRANLKAWVEKNEIFYNEKVAKRIFDSLFMETGVNKARRIGLLNQNIFTNSVLILFFFGSVLKTIFNYIFNSYQIFAFQLTSATFQYQLL